MNNKFESNSIEVPTWLMERLRQYNDLEEDDISQDERILKMLPEEMLREYLEWEGIQGYCGEIIEVIKYAYGIDLDDISFWKANIRTKESE